ncbi:hypothetical protein PENSUB_3122 [Penicillium subrubescens]|uniref:Uncharacterized protein n=1 Tax=Penicillium subrubescens TaxID=1316194 RepID=A0A1Q5UFW8_9EURO|nr:hypothetical protein PENSUB_5097 [Penicillium subrubescens]OKP11364.1 hypothetical protein PENSUB_3122 [Penicillium subrubescens]
MYIIRDDSQLAIFFRETENATCQEDIGICGQWWKVRPSLTIFEVRGDWEGMIGSRGTIVDSSLETVVKKNWPAV